MKKFCSLALTGVMLLSMAPSALAAEPTAAPASESDDNWSWSSTVVLPGGQPHFEVNRVDTEKHPNFGDVIMTPTDSHTVQGQMMPGNTILFPHLDDQKPTEKPESKPEAKPESKPEAKPEVKPEVKPEAKPETIPEVKPGDVILDATLVPQPDLVLKDPYFTVGEVILGPDGSSTVVTKKDGGYVTSTTFVSGTTLLQSSARTDLQQITNPNGVNTLVKDANTDCPVYTVTLPSSEIHMVELPIKPQEAPITLVAVDKATNRVIPTCVATEGSMNIQLKDSGELVLRDNAKSFQDTQGHWAEDAIDFVTSRELFSGTSQTSFTPNQAMTRAMLMTVLARLDGADTTVSPFAQGMEWAKENGISDGSNPNGTISRQQLVTMLWRYANEPTAKSAELDFPDADTVSSYAQEPLAWAVETGLISGTADGSLNPNGQATRAQLAVILQRFVNSQMNG